MGNPKVTYLSQPLKSKRKNPLKLRKLMMRAQTVPTYSLSLSTRTWPIGRHAKTASSLLEITTVW